MNAERYTSEQLNRAASDLAYDLDDPDQNGEYTKMLRQAATDATTLQSLRDENAKYRQALSEIYATSIHPERVDTSPGYDHLGKISHMVTSGGYVMVHRPRAMPFVMSIKEWAKLPKHPNDDFEVAHGRVTAWNRRHGEGV